MTNRRKRRDGALARIVAMEVVSGLGDGFFWVGLAAMLVARHLGAAAFAAAALARYGPRAILSPPASVLADRVDRRTLLVGLDFGRAAAMAIAALLATKGSVGAVLALVFVTYTLAAPYRPALTAALPLCIGEDGLSAANALISTVRQTMTFVGPLLGVVVLRVSSPAWALAADALTFAVSAALIASVAGLSGQGGTSRSGLSDHRRAWHRQLRAGARDLRATSGLLSLSFAVFVMYVARGAESILFVYVAGDRLALGASGVGILCGAVGLGAIAVLPLTRRLGDVEWTTSGVIAAMAATAAPLALLAAIRSSVVACVVLALLGAGVVAFEVLSVTMLQRLVALDALTRVHGVVGTASNGGKLLGAVAAPAAALQFGLGPTLVAVGAIVAGVSLACRNGLRRASQTAGSRREQLRPVVDVLRGYGLFDFASTPTLERLAEGVTEETVPPHQVVIRKGDVADDLFLVRTGTMSVWDEGVQINAMGAGEWFGEIGLLQRSPRTATVVASSDAVLWRIRGDLFLSTMRVAAFEPALVVDVMADRLARSAAHEQGRRAVLN